MGLFFRMAIWIRLSWVDFFSSIPWSTCSWLGSLMHVWSAGKIGWSWLVHNGLPWDDWGLSPCGCSSTCSHSDHEVLIPTTGQTLL